MTNHVDGKSIIVTGAGHGFGRLTAGKLADYVVLGEDPTVVKPDRIKDIRILETVVDGRSQYRA